MDPNMKCRPQCRVASATSFVGNATSHRLHDRGAGHTDTHDAAKGGTTRCGGAVHASNHHDLEPLLRGQRIPLVYKGLRVSAVGSRIPLPSTGQSGKDTVVT